jgi:hypothetical protein
MEITLKEIFLFKAGKKLVNSVLMEMLTITTKDLLKHRQAYLAI